MSRLDHGYGLVYHTHMPRRDRQPRRPDLRQKFVVQVPLSQDLYASLKTAAAYYQTTMAGMVRRLITPELLTYERDPEIMRLPPKRLANSPGTLHDPQPEGYLGGEPRVQPHRLRSPWDQDTFDE